MTNLKRTGTTAPIYIPAGHPGSIIRPGESYLFARIISAQVEYAGKFWEGDADLIITSQVSINHSTYDPPPVFNIQKIRKVKKNTVQLTGIASNLIDIVPATMHRFSISVNFVLDKTNRFSILRSLVDDSILKKAASFLPGLSQAPEIVSNIAKRLFNSLLGDEVKENTLQLDADFNIASGDLQDGYYLILNSASKEHPLPESLDSPTIVNGQLIMNGKPVSVWNYFIFELRSISAKSRALANNAAWDQKLREAENLAQQTGLNPDTDQQTRQRTFSTCAQLLRDAQLLLLIDTSYLPSEASTIIKIAYHKCRTYIFNDGSSTTIRFRGWAETNNDTNYGKDLLNIRPDEDLAELSRRYQQEEIDSLKLLKTAGFA